MAGVVADRGLLEELLSGLAGHEALLRRLSEIDPDPCWLRRLERVRDQVAGLRAALGLESPHEPA